MLTIVIDSYLATPQLRCPLWAWHTRILFYRYESIL